jgi:16S rRNA U1498 N3-methylase RsmE
MNEKEKIETIVADIRNKLSPITTYFAIRKNIEEFPEKREKLEKILRDCEKQCNISLPIIIEQLKNLNRISDEK